jgi:hypothetical protein
VVQVCCIRAIPGDVFQRTARKAFVTRASRCAAARVR